MLVVEAKIKDKRIRFINGYGPQDDAEEEVRESFFSRIDIEVKSAKLAGTLICLEMDANAKLGKEIITDDPNDQSKNGKLLEEVLIENDLVVVNAQNICHGVITRHRQTVNSTEKSVLDYFIVCRGFYVFIKSMIIDEERAYSLTKYSGKTGNKKSKESDHNTLILEVDINWNTSTIESEERIEIFNLNDTKNFENFVASSSKNNTLKDAFMDETEDLEDSTQKWLKTVNKLISSSFSKVRIIRGKIYPDLEELFQKKEDLKHKIALSEKDDLEKEIELKETLELVLEQISDLCAD